MKKLVSTFLSLLAVLICSAQSEVNVNVTDAGTLGTLLGEKKNEVTKLTVAGKINGDDVAVLRDMTNAALKDIDLKDAVIVAGGSAFYKDQNGVEWNTEDNKVPGHMFDQCILNSIVLPETVLEIGESAFNGCTNLTSVIFGSQLKKIGNNAFYNCEGLTDIYLPDYMEEIGENTFANCKNIANVHFSLNLKNIGAMSFMECVNLQEVILPEGLISLGMKAFFNAKGVKKVVLPASLSDIQSEAFSNCVSLMEIYEYAVNIPTFGSDVFNGVDKNKCVVYVPTGMANDYSECNAFMDFANIQEFKTTQRDVTVTVTKPGTLGSLLGNETLKSIEKITIKGKINNDDLCILSMMTQGVDYISEKREYNLRYIDMQDADIVAGGEDNYADGEFYFSADNTLTGCTFNYRTGLEQIILPKSLEVIGEGAFNGATNVTDVTIFDKVREIEGSAFYGSGIRHINLPEGIETIHMSTFSSCENLEEITLPSSLKNIEKMAFMNCKLLEEIRIPEGISTFGMGVFFGCEKLMRVWLPSTITDMGSMTFTSCYDIEEIHVSATTPPAWNNKPFEYIYEKAVLYVPVGCKEAYKSVVDEEGNGWGAFYNIQEENGEVTGINNSVVDDMEGAEYYNINGVRIDKPTNGIYIIRMKNGKVKKMSVR